jgi:hypothetical protein
MANPLEETRCLSGFVYAKDLINAEWCVPRDQDDEKGR